MHSRQVVPVVIALLATAVLVSGAAGVRAAQEAATSQRSPVDVGAAPDDVLTAGRSVRVQRKVAGDLAAAGLNVTVDAPVNGYVMSAGRRVTLHGSIGNDVWAAGEIVTVDGTVANNTMLAGRVVHLGPAAVVGQHARLVGGTVATEGRVQGGLVIGADAARIGGDIGGAVRARATRVSVLPGAVIRGDLVVRASEPPEISPQARILGEVSYEDADSGWWLVWSVRWVFLLASLLILGLAALTFSPAWSVRVAGTIHRRIGASILSGLIVLVVLPVAIVGLAGSVIGIPLAIVLLALLVATLLLSGVFVSYRTGDWLFARIHRAQASRWARMALGVAVISLLMSLPTVGMPITAAVLIIGTGALLLERRAGRADRFAPGAA
jgi:hypothetical protein